MGNVPLRLNIWAGSPLSWIIMDIYELSSLLIFQVPPTNLSPPVFREQAVAKPRWFSSRFTVFIFLILDFDLRALWLAVTEVYPKPGVYMSKWLIHASRQFCAWALTLPHLLDNHFRNECICLFSPLYLPLPKLGLFLLFDRDFKSLKPWEREKVYEVINGVDRTATFLQTHFDLAETLLILDGFLALGILVIFSSVWSAANLDNLVRSDH